MNYKSLNASGKGRGSAAPYFAYFAAGPSGVTFALKLELSPGLAAASSGILGVVVYFCCDY